MIQACEIVFGSRHDEGAVSDLELTEALVGRRGCELVARVDAGAAAGYLSLVAPALGLGVCVVTSWSESAVQEVLELPATVRPEILVAVGYPAAQPSKTVKATPPTVHWDRYGNLGRTAHGRRFALQAHRLPRRLPRD